MGYQYKQVAEQLNTQNANNKIPLVDLKSNYNRMKKEIDASIADVLQSCYFIGSPHVKQFEKNFATFIGTKHCIGVNSGTDALILTNEILGIGPGDYTLYRLIHLLQHVSGYQIMEQILFLWIMIQIHT